LSFAALVLGFPGFCVRLSGKGEVMVKLFQSVGAALLLAGALGLAGCADETTSGGSSVFGGTSGTVGAGPGPGPTPTPGPTGIQVQLLASSSQMPSAGTTTVDLAAVVTDATGQAVSGSFVTFSRGNDPTAFFTDISTGSTTSANGTVTAKLNLGANKSNRIINLTATTAGATGTTAVDVTGTTINVSGNTSLALNASTTLTFTVTDSAAVPLPGFVMTLASAAGNPIATPAGTTTNSAGQVVANVTGSVAGNDTITATAAGATKAQSLTVSGASFAFTAPAPNVDIPLNTAAAVNVNWPAGVGQLVSFSSSRGTPTPSSQTVDGAGNTPGVTVLSSIAGPAIITAQGPGGTPAATLNVTFVATTADTVAVQAVPGTVQVTTGSPSQTNNLSTISVVVRDAFNNLVKNASVNFNITMGGGSLAAQTAITDVSGSASVTYIADTISSAQNGVRITATVTAIGAVPIPPISNFTELTVAGQSLLVRLGTDNLVESQPPVNKKTWAAIVTDAAGNAVAGVTVRFALRPGRYRKGYWEVPLPPAPQSWRQVITSPLVAPTFPDCANEDLNFNGILDAGEDLNGSLALEPGGVATVNPTAVTDASGVAEAIITYPKSYAHWAEVELEARTGVVGNDPPTIAKFFLVGLAADYSDIAVSPPGNPSPFGFSTTCADTL
jgi:hypothetical protein